MGDLLVAEEAEGSQFLEATQRQWDTTGAGAGVMGLTCLVFLTNARV